MTKEEAFKLSGNILRLWDKKESPPKLIDLALDIYARHHASLAWDSGFNKGWIFDDENDDWKIEKEQYLNKTFNQ